MLKLLSIKAIPQVTAEVSQYDSELWTGIIGRLKQMSITNSSEHRVNWNIKP